MNAISLKNAPSPNTRIVRLLAAALPLLSSSHAAFALLEEAHRTAAGLDPYLEKSSTSLIVPASHGVPEAEVQAVWAELLLATEEEDWKALYKAGKTKWELNKAMCSGAYEATFLQSIAISSCSTRCLEIGLFTGTTTLALALLPKIQSVVALDIEPLLEDYDRPYWKRAGVSDKIETRIGTAVDSLRKLKADGAKPFDLVFIDADKPSYTSYVSLILELDLLAKNGIILADNTLYKGYVYAPSDDPLTPATETHSNNQSHDVATQGIVDFNAYVRTEPRLHVFMLPLRDGVSIISRKI